MNPKNIGDRGTLIPRPSGTPFETLDLQREFERCTFAVQENTMESYNRHWKKGGSRTTNPFGWREVLPPIVVPTALLGPSTHIRMCAFALRFSGTAQVVLPSGGNNVVAKI